MDTDMETRILRLERMMGGSQLSPSDTLEERLFKLEKGLYSNSDIQAFMTLYDKVSADWFIL